MNLLSAPRSGPERCEYQVISFSRAWKNWAVNNLATPDMTRWPRRARTPVMLPFPTKETRAASPSGLIWKVPSAATEPILPSTVDDEAVAFRGQLVGDLDGAFEAAVDRSELDVEDRLVLLPLDRDQLLDSRGAAAQHLGIVEQVPDRFGVGLKLVAAFETQSVSRFLEEPPGPAATAQGGCYITAKGGLLYKGCTGLSIAPAGRIFPGLRNMV